MIKRILRILSTRAMIYKANINGNTIDWGTGIDKKLYLRGRM